jgi:hypothetical protein
MEPIAAVIDAATFTILQNMKTLNPFSEKLLKPPLIGITASLLQVNISFTEESQ